MIEHRKHRAAQRTTQMQGRTIDRHRCIERCDVRGDVVETIGVVSGQVAHSITSLEQGRYVVGTTRGQWIEHYVLHSQDRLERGQCNRALRVTPMRWATAPDQ